MSLMIFFSCCSILFFSLSRSLIALFKARWFCLSISSGVFFLPKSHSKGMIAYWSKRNWKKIKWTYLFWPELLWLLQASHIHWGFHVHNHNVQVIPQPYQNFLLLNVFSLIQCIHLAQCLLWIHKEVPFWIASSQTNSQFHFLVSGGVTLVTVWYYTDYHRISQSSFICLESRFNIFSQSHDPSVQLLDSIYVSSN